MRILVYPHDLSIGGSQINAIELAERVQRLGHEVIIFGTPGPLVERISDLGLEFLPAKSPGRRPDLTIVRELARLADDRSIDILHGYEWPPALECFLAARANPGTRAVSTVMSMAVAPFIPRALPLVVGTRQIEAAERQSGRSRVRTIEPPVDLDFNNSAVDVGTDRFRREWDLDPSAVNVVTVTRLAHEMKLEGLLAAIRGIVAMGRELYINLLIVGDGPAWPDVAEAAHVANCRLGRVAVRLTGALIDPRPAYAASDIQIAMGSSALRSMAFGKPTLVQGERGFWRMVDESSVDDFLWAGMYGVGESVESGTSNFLSQILPAVQDPDLRVRLGQFGRMVAAKHFSLDAAAAAQADVYLRAQNYPYELSLKQTTRSIIHFGFYKASRLSQRIFLNAPLDDFNSNPVIAIGAAATEYSDRGSGSRNAALHQPLTFEPYTTSAGERVAVILVTYNSVAHLPRFLNSLAAGFEGVDYELVVVDNASTDGSIAIVQDFDSATVQVIRSAQNLGYAAAINLGVKNCTATTTAFLVVNPDIEFQPNCVSALLRGLRIPGVGVAVPQPLDSLGKRVPSIRRRPTVRRALGEAIIGPLRAGRYPRWGDLVTDPEEYTYEHNVSWAEGSAQLIASECWGECGEWDETYFLYSEETEFDLRIQDHGYAVRFVPDARVVHHKGESTVDPKLWSLLMANRVRLFYRRRGLVPAVPYWMASVLREGRRTLMGHSTSRRALTTLLSPRRMRERPTARWTA